MRVSLFIQTPFVSSIEWFSNGFRLDSLCVFMCRRSIRNDCFDAIVRFVIRVRIRRWLAIDILCVRPCWIDLVHSFPDFSA